MARHGETWQEALTVCAFTNCQQLGPSLCAVTNTFSPHCCRQTANACSSWHFSPTINDSIWMMAIQAGDVWQEDKPRSDALAALVGCLFNSRLCQQLKTHLRTFLQILLPVLAKVQILHAVGMKNKWRDLASRASVTLTG